MPKYFKEIDAESIKTENEIKAESVSTDELFNDDRDPDVVIKKTDSGTVKAIGDDDEGEIASGSDFTTVLHSARDALTSGRSWKEKILVKGDFTLSSTFEPKDNMIIELRGRVQLADSADVDMVKNADTANGNAHIEFIGGVWDGNKANNPTGSSGKHIFTTRECDDVKFLNVTAKNASRDAFVPQGSWTDYQYISCIAEDNYWDGFNPLGGQGCEIIGGFSRYNGDHGVHPSSSVSDVTISNHIAHDNAGDNYNIQGNNVEMESCIGRNPGDSNVFIKQGFHDITVSGWYTGATNEGVHASGIDGTEIENLKLTDLTVTDNGAAGIWLEYCPDAVLDDVRSTESTSSNIDIDNSDDVRIIAPTAGNETTSFVNSAQSCIRVRSGSPDCRISEPVVFDDQGVASDPIVRNGARVRQNGTIELGGAPSDSNYDVDDAGTDIYDTSTSPWTEYVIDKTGTPVDPSAQ